MRIHYNLDEIKKIVEELMPPKNNHLIGTFKLEFLVSHKKWDYVSNEVEMSTQRGFSYTIRRATIQEEIDYLISNLEEHYEYFDNHADWKDQVELRERIKKLQDENQIWILQELSKVSL